MPLSQAKLSLVFQGPLVLPEAEVIDGLATRFLDFFLDSTVAAVAAAPGPLAPADLAFRAAAIGVSQAGAGAAKLQGAITAFWAAAILVAPTVWVTIPVIMPGTALVPPGLGGIAAAITSVGASNLAAKLALAPAADAIAVALMPTQLGATVTLSPPPPGGTPLVPVL